MSEISKDKEQCRRDANRKPAVRWLSDALCPPRCIRCENM